MRIFEVAVLDAIERRQLLQKARREQLRQERESLLRTKTYNACLAVVLISLMIGCAAALLNLLLSFSDSFSAFTVGILLATAMPMSVAIAIMGLTRLVIVPMYERLRLRRAERGVIQLLKSDCALCLMGVAHKD